MSIYLELFQLYSHLTFCAFQCFEDSGDRLIHTPNYTSSYTSSSTDDSSISSFPYILCKSLMCN